MVPVKFPSMLVTRVPAVTETVESVPVPVVVPIVNLSTLSSHMMAALLPVLPRSNMNPKSFELLVAPVLSSIKESSTTEFVVDMVVVAPLIVRSPVTTRLSLTVTVEVE